VHLGPDPRRIAARGDGAGSNRRLVAASIGESPVNGSRPVTISNITTPSA